MTYNRNDQKWFSAVFIAPWEKEQDDENRRNIVYQLHVDFQLSYVGLNFIDKTGSIASLRVMCRLIDWAAKSFTLIEIDPTDFVQE